MKKTFPILLLLLLAACTKPGREAQPLGLEPLVQTYFNHFNNHAWPQLAALYADTVATKDPESGTALVRLTRAQLLAKYSALHQFIPDVHDSIVAIYPSGDAHVVVEFVSRGTTPDGRPFVLPICTVFKIEQGLITQDFTYFDNFEE